MVVFPATMVAPSAGDKEVLEPDPEKSCEPVVSKDSMHPLLASLYWTNSVAVLLQQRATYQEFSVRYDSSLRTQLLGHVVPAEVASYV